jgi:hypothetical protein
MSNNKSGEEVLVYDFGDEDLNSKYKKLTKEEQDYVNRFTNFNDKKYAVIFLSDIELLRLKSSLSKKEKEQINKLPMRDQVLLLRNLIKEQEKKEQEKKDREKTLESKFINKKSKLTDVDEIIEPPEEIFEKDLEQIEQEDKDFVE